MVAQTGVDAVGEALITGVAGESAWRSFPDELRRVLIQNRPAILAELEGQWWLQADAAALAGASVGKRVCHRFDRLVELGRRVGCRHQQDRLPNRGVLVGGGHIIDPAAPEVIAYVEEVLEGR
ncbi:MAG: hypothetical protein ACRDPC_15870 [Solirubrobacteraceae bacterium]